MRQFSPIIRSPEKQLRTVAIAVVFVAIVVSGLQIVFALCSVHNQLYLLNAETANPCPVSKMLSRVSCANITTIESQKLRANSGNMAKTSSNVDFYHAVDNSMQQLQVLQHQLKHLEHMIDQQRNEMELLRKQQRTAQYLSRQSVSHNLCGAFPNVSANAKLLPTVLTTLSNKRCIPNVITYLVQKGKHSSYDRNSTALFLMSLDLLYKNYLSIDNHYDNVDIFIVHTGDHTMDDLLFLESRYNNTVHFKLVDLNNTDFWTLPEVVKPDDVGLWSKSKRFSVGYRHMIRWYALRIYDFLRDFGAAEGCQYNFLLRMDEDSFVHSPIGYDLFDFVQSNNFSYAYRMVSYEMDMNVWDDYVDHVNYCGGMLPLGIPHRQLRHGLAGIYNNFFIVELDFIMRPDVQHFLQWIDALGIMYRDRFGDMQVQTITALAFLPPERIHRFLDWTYEHFTLDNDDCPYWGALQSGYLDPNINETFDIFHEEFIKKRGCLEVNHLEMNYLVLSPTYSHLPNSSWFEQTFHVPLADYTWRTYQGGRVEIARYDQRSG